MKKSFVSRLVITGIGITLLSLTFVSCDKKEDDVVTPAIIAEEVDEVTDPNETADLAPAFTLKSTTGSDVSLSDFKGKVVVLFFFGNTCPSCVAAAPTVQSMLVDGYASQDKYMLLGLDQWNGNEAAVKGFGNTTRVSFPLLLNGASVSAAYKSTYDRLVVIDKAGYIRFNGQQNAVKDIASAKAVIDMYLAK